MKTSRARAAARRTPAGNKPRPRQRSRALSAAQVAAAVEAMAAPSGTARFAAGKSLTVTAERDPARVYPHVDAIAKLLDAEGKIVRWNAMQILAALAPVDAHRKLDAVLGQFLAFIRGSNMVSAANAARVAGKVALSRPDVIDRVVPGILAVEGATYETPECRNVAIGHVLGILAELGPAVCHRPDVAAFIRRQCANTRAAVARRAMRMAADLA